MNIRLMHSGSHLLFWSTEWRPCYCMLDNGKHNIKLVLVLYISSVKHFTQFYKLLGSIKKWVPPGTLTCSPGRGVWHRPCGHSTGHRPRVCSPWCLAGCCPCPTPAATAHSPPSLQLQPSAEVSWWTTWE